MFSIVIPTYNRDEDLENCIISIKENTVLPYEIIVMHNNSTSTKSVCEKYNIHQIFDNARNNGKRTKGLWTIINDGIKQAKYDLVMYLNDDCLVLPQWDINATKYFTNTKTGLLVLKTKGIGASPDFKIIHSLFSFPCANYAIINKKADILFDENYDWFWGDADLPLQFALQNKYKIFCTTENMIIHNHRIDETRQENEKDEKSDPDYIFFNRKWTGYKRRRDYLLKFSFLDKTFRRLKRIIKKIIKKPL